MTGGPGAGDGPEPIIVLVDPEILDLIPGFLANRRSDIEVACAALARGDIDLIQNVGHALKGMGGGYGFHEITRIGGDLEAAARDGDREVLAPLLEELRHYLDRVVVEPDPDEE